MNMEIANIGLEIVANIVRFYAVKRMVTSFLKNSECRWKHTWILYVIACCSTSIVYELFKNPGYNVVVNISMMLLIVYPYKARWLKKILFAMAIYIIGVAVESIVVFSFTNYTIGGPFNQIYECIVSLILLLIVLVLEKSILTEREAELPVWYNIVLGAVPVVSIGYMCCLAYIYLRDENAKLLICAFAIWTLMINIVILYLYDWLTRFYSEKMEKKKFEQMVDVYEQQLNTMQESQEYVKALRHDMKHHIIELSSMLNKEDHPEALAYLKNMEQFMLNPREHIATGNHEIDGVLNYLLQDVEDVLEQVNINVSMQEKSEWKDFQVCVILGNLVDNAIQAASDSEEKYLDINIQSKKGILLIHIENRYSGQIVQERNRFRTSKKSIHSIHGIGLESVKKVVEMNGGEMKIVYGQGRFKVKVLLYLSNSNQIENSMKL